VYVDSHCHIDRYPHPEAVLRAATRSQVVTIAVTDTPSSFKRSSSMVQPGSLLQVAVGVHPLGASRTSEHDLNLFARLLDQTDYVGEIGLDYSIHGRPTRQRQTEIFERILAAPSIREKVLTVHSRQAEADTVRMLAEARVHAILHWYQGAIKHLDAALDAGMFFSVNISMLSTRRGQRIIAALPAKRVLTETDGPYTEHEGRPNEPRHVPVLVAALASLWNEDHEVVRDRLFENMATLHARATGAPGENTTGQGADTQLDRAVVWSSNPPPFSARQISLFTERSQATRGATPTDAGLRGAP
jgi:TatD DNase family protein